MPPGPVTFVADLSLFSAVRRHHDKTVRVTSPACEPDAESGRMALRWHADCRGTTTMSRTTALCCVLGMIISGCASDGGADPKATAVGANETTGECSWPAALDTADAAAGECRAARHHLTCRRAAGGFVSCLSNDPTVCPNGEGTACESKCAAGEYAIACGAVGPGSWPQPPAHCRNVGTTPGGISFACCPCGS